MNSSSNPDLAVPSNPRDSEQADPQFAYTLAKGLSVLRAFESGGRRMSNRELSVMTGISRPTVARLTRTLSMLGYLRYDDRDARYRLTASMARLVYPLLSQLNVRQIARPLMQQLANHALGSVSLGMRDGTDIVIVETCVDNSSATGRPEIGVARPMALTSLGYAYLAGLPNGERESVLDEIRADQRCDWKVVGPQIATELARFKTKGFCIGTDAAGYGFYGVGVPLMPEPGGELMVFNCAVAPFNLKENALENDIGPRLVNLKQNVEMSMGVTGIQKNRERGLIEIRGDRPKFSR